jgi:hypothetical protein
LGREGAPKKQRASTRELKIETSGAIVEDRRIVRGDEAQRDYTSVRFFFAFSGVDECNRMLRQLTIPKLRNY